MDDLRYPVGMQTRALRNKSVSEAMEQIHSRDYAERYALDSRNIYLIGANFSENK